MKKILLPTDFSENSWNAIKYALELFKDKECVFYLLNTYTPIVYNKYFEIKNEQEGFIDTIAESSKKGLDKLHIKIKSIFKNQQHIFSKISSFNTLINEIEELHKGNIIDLIVMGTQGATGLKGVLFGSNTIHVIKNANCPVLAIPNDFSFEPPHEVLFPSDYEIDFQDKHIQPIIDLVSSYKPRINILNASFGYELSEKQERNKQKLEVYFKHIAHLFHSIKNQNVTEAINNFQLKVRINLLIMINNKHSFFENLFFKSKIKQIGFHLNIPFFVIPTKK